MRGALEWAQALSVAPKGVISLVIVAVAGLVLILLWQRPPETAPEKPKGAALSQTGNVASTDQSGGVTAGLYINQAPPVTAQQKAEALLSLQSEIEELKNFPDRPDSPQPRTLMEQFTKNTMPHQLFVVLSKYYKETIISVPNYGEALFAYKQQYYEYEKKEYDFESDAVTQIGHIVTVRFRQAWLIYLRYFFLRSAGLTQQQIVDGGDFLNYSITWDDAERVVSEIGAKYPAVSQNMKETFSLQANVLAAATNIMNSYEARLAK